MVLIESDNNLRERLNEFTADVVRLVEDFPKSRSGNHLADRVLNSALDQAVRRFRGNDGTVSARDDLLEQLNDTLYYLRLAHRVDLLRHKNFLEDVIDQGDELIGTIQK